MGKDVKLILPGDFVYEPALKKAMEDNGFPIPVSVFTNPDVNVKVQTGQFERLVRSKNGNDEQILFYPRKDSLSNEALITHKEKGLERNISLVDADRDGDFECAYTLTREGKGKNKREITIDYNPMPDGKIYVIKTIKDYKGNVIETQEYISPEK